MESIRLYFVLILVTGTLWKVTSAGMMGRLYQAHNGPQRKGIRIPIISNKVNILEEAKAAFASAGHQVKFNLAPTYGTLNSETLKDLDESLKVMMGGILEMNLHEGVTWNEVRSVLESSPLIIRQPNLAISRLKKISFDSVRYLGFNSQYKERMIKIASWFSQLISNADILQDTNIDLDTLATMVSKKTLDIMDNIFSEQINKINMIDLGILRFPDFSQPFFTLYRINLMGKCSYNTYLVHQKERSDVVGLFQKEVYYPNQNFISQMSEDLTDQLLMEVDDLFSYY